MPSPQEPYITVKEAARRIDYSVYQTDRFIKQRELEAIHVNASLRKVLVTSVGAFTSRHGRRPVDPLEPMKDTLRKQEQVAGDILRQLALLCQQVEERGVAWQKRISDLEGQLRLLKTQFQQEREALQGLEQAVAALAPMTGAEGNQNAFELVRQLLTRLPRASQRGQLPQEKCGYGPSTIRWSTSPSSMAWSQARYASMRRERPTWRRSMSEHTRRSRSANGGSSRSSGDGCSTTGRLRTRHGLRALIAL